MSEFMWLNACSNTCVIVMFGIVMFFLGSFILLNLRMRCRVKQIEDTTELDRKIKRQSLSILNKVLVVIVYNFIFLVFKFAYGLISMELSGLCYITAGNLAVEGLFILLYNILNCLSLVTFLCLFWRKRLSKKKLKGLQTTRGSDSPRKSTTSQVLRNSLIDAHNKNTRNTTRSTLFETGEIFLAMSERGLTTSSKETVTLQID